MLFFEKMAKILVPLSRKSLQPVTMENITGKTVIINKPAYQLYTAFSNMNSFAANLPEQFKDKITIGPDFILITMQGFSLGAKVNSRTPFSRIDFEQYGQVPFPFLASFFFEPKDDDSTYFHLELRAELNMMLKMMIGGKLKDAVEKITDGIAKAASGEVPAEWSDFAKQNGFGI